MTPYGLCQEKAAKAGGAEMELWWERYTQDDLEILTPVYERLRNRGLSWGPDGFDMETLDRMFASKKWNYKIKQTLDGYEAMVQLNFVPGATDYGMGEGRLPEIAILLGLDLAMANGWSKG